MVEFTFDDGGLKDLQKKLEALPEEQSVTFDKLFPDAFMVAHTDFATIQAFVDAMEAEANKPDAFWDIPETAKDSFVQRQTTFADWEEMKGQAGEEWMARELGLEE